MHNEKTGVFKVHYKDHKCKRLGRTEVKKEEYEIILFRTLRH